LSARAVFILFAMLIGVHASPLHVSAQARVLSSPPPAGARVELGSSSEPSAPAVTPSADVPARAGAAPLEPAAREEEERDVERMPECITVPKKKEPMNGWAVGLRVGFTQVGQGDVRNPAYSSALADLASMVSEQTLIDSGLRGGSCTPLDKRCRTDARSGFEIAIPVQLGGSGVGFRIEPYLTVTSRANAYGVYMGPTFELRVAKPVYLGFGFGLKSAWVKPQDWRYAIDLHGRIPAHVTLYATDDVAFVLEAAFGAGASAFVNQPRPIRNPLTGKRLQNIPNVTFGLARTWDISLGVRFP
jgi:hypothetical protein